MFIVTVKYGYMRSIANFKSKDGKFKIGDKVIIKTDRGTEVGEIICEPEEVEETSSELQFLSEIIRNVQKEDEKKIERIIEIEEPKAVKFCLACVRELKLQMDILCAEQTFGNEKLIFYFFASQRIDFRELVKQLAKEFKTRIEMWQVGVRDAARLKSDCGACGYPTCCNGWIRKLDPVSLKSAKNQGLPLDVDRLAGVCGRLKCCIRFEDSFYSEEKKMLPPKGSKVITKFGEGKVKDLNVFKRIALIEDANGKFYSVTHQDVLQILESPTEEQKEDTSISMIEE